MNRIIDRVDFAGFAARPKVVIGYSDITVLLLALMTETGVVDVSRPDGALRDAAACSRVTTLNSC